MEGSRGIALLILNVGFRWRYVFNITLQPLYYRKRMPRIRPKRFLENRKSLAPAGIRNPGSSALSESLNRLRYLDCHKFFTYRKCAIVYFFLSLNIDSFLQVRYNLPTNDPSCDPRQSRMSLLPPKILQVMC